MNSLWNNYRKRPLGVVALSVVALFVLVGLYAPLLAASKPIAVKWDGSWYFPLFRYLFYKGYYSKGVDLFFNVLMFIFPLFVIALFCPFKKWTIGILTALQLVISFSLIVLDPSDPASDPRLTSTRRAAQDGAPSWQFELAHMNTYGKLNQILRYRQRLAHHEKFVNRYPHITKPATLWAADQSHFEDDLNRVDAQKAQYLFDREEWLSQESQKVTSELTPLVRPFHWQEDAAGSASQNRQVKWWDLTRTNRKDLVASLIFGIRISLVVGLTAVVLSLLIGIPLGAMAGYFGGRCDIFLSRFLEIWEAMPTFFMLLTVIAILQSKSIFLVVAVLGIFGWTGFARYLRSEVLKQRNLAYVEACHSLGYPHRRIIFSHILPNAIPPLLTLLPFSVMAAITAEAGLSFLGLGEEGSTSWGVLMDEGRSVFPAESYLLWPPAILLTILLVAIAILGDALRDALDPKMR